MTEQSKSYEQLTTFARDAMEQLFVCGPVHDYAACAPTGTRDLEAAGLAHRCGRWTALSPPGLAVALEADVSRRPNTRWHRKQQCQN